MESNHILIHDIHTLVTMQEPDAVLHDVDLLVIDNKVAQISKHIEPTDAMRRIDGRHHVVYPGFINLHHHFYQTLTRNIPGVHNAKLFDWLVYLYEIWRELTPEAVEISTKIAISELFLSGCTTAVDHFYVFPNKAPAALLDTEIEAARAMGMRFYPTRGSMSRGRSQGGLPPDDVTQTPDAIMTDCERVVNTYHDADAFSMTRIVLAPCSPFSVTRDLMEETAAYAKQHELLIHTHLCETKDEEAYCVESLGLRPLDYMEETGWLHDHVWYAHGIYFNDREIARLAAAGAGIAHCPVSNLRLGSGICRVPALMDAGVHVGLAVDGSASNDSSNFLREMQTALLVHRIGTAVDAMPPRRVLDMATRQGAAILKTPEIGHLSVGSAADLAMFRLDRVEFAGAMTDPASAHLFCGSAPRAAYTMVNGRLVVEKGQVTGLDEEQLWSDAQNITKKMLMRSGRI